MSKWRISEAKKVAGEMCLQDIGQHTASLISIANEMQSRVSPTGSLGMPAGRVREAQVELLKAVQLGLDNGLLRSDIREAITSVVRESETSDEARAAVYQVLKAISPLR